MENVLLIIHLILALSLIGLVLMQRSEGGMGSMGGGAGGPAAAGRAAATALSKITWVLFGGFIATSIALTIVAASKSADSSVLDRLQDAPAAAETVETPALGDDLLPPAEGESAPLVPRAD